MIGADTNMLVRFLVRDIEEQAQAVKKILDEKETLYINQVVLSELSWILLKVYEYQKYDLLRVLDTLFEIQGFEFFDQEVVKSAITSYVNSSADFNDCLICEINRNSDLETLTFDKKAAKLEGMNLLK